MMQLAATRIHLELRFRLLVHSRAATSSDVKFSLFPPKFHRRGFLYFTSIEFAHIARRDHSSSSVTPGDPPSYVDWGSFPTGHPRDEDDCCHPSGGSPSYSLTRQSAHNSVCSF